MGGRGNEESFSDYTVLYGISICRHKLSTYLPSPQINVPSQRGAMPTLTIITMAVAFNCPTYQLRFCALCQTREYFNEMVHYNH